MGTHTLEIGLFFAGVAVTFLQIITIFILNDMKERIERLESRAMGEQTGWDGRERRIK